MLDTDLIMEPLLTFLPQPPPVEEVMKEKSPARDEPPVKERMGEIAAALDDNQEQENKAGPALSTVDGVSETLDKVSLDN